MCRHCRGIDGDLQVGFDSGHCDPQLLITGRLVLRFFERVRYLGVSSLPNLEALHLQNNAALEELINQRLVCVHGPDSFQLTSLGLGCMEASYELRKFELVLDPRFTLLTEAPRQLCTYELLMWLVKEGWQLRLVPTRQSQPCKPYVPVSPSADQTSEKVLYCKTAHVTIAQSYLLALCLAQTGILKKPVPHLQAASYYDVLIDGKEQERTTSNAQRFQYLPMSVQAVENEKVRHRVGARKARAKRQPLPAHADERPLRAVLAAGDEAAEQEPESEGPHSAESVSDAVASPAMPGGSSSDTSTSSSTSSSSSSSSTSSSSSSSRQPETRAEEPAASPPRDDVPGSHVRKRMDISTIYKAGRLTPRNAPEDRDLDPDHVVAYQMTCHHPSHQSRKCTRTLSVTVAGDMVMARRMLKQWLLFSYQGDSKEAHKASWGEVQRLKDNGNLPAEAELNAQLDTYTHVQPVSASVAASSSALVGDLVQPASASAAASSSASVGGHEEPGPASGAASSSASAGVHAIPKARGMSRRQRQHGQSQPAAKVARLDAAEVLGEGEQALVATVPALEELIAAGDLPRTSEEQRRRQTLVHGTTYRVPPFLRGALQAGYINPNLPAPRGMQWRPLDAKTWSLQPRGG